MKQIALFISFVTVLCQNLCGQSKEINIEYLFNKGQEFHYINRDSAYFYYEKVISLSDAQNNLDYLFMGHSYLINANGHFYDLPEYKRNIERLDNILQNDRRIDSFEWADYYRNYILFDKGNYYYKTREYTTSKKHFLELYNNIEGYAGDGLFLEDIEMLSSINSFLGLINYHTGKYEQAEFTYRRDIELVKKHADSLEDWQSSIISSKKLLSQVYEAQNKQKEANVLLNEAMEFYSAHAKDPRYRNSYLSTLLLLAKNYCKQEDYQKSLDLLNQREKLSNNPFSREMSLIEGDAFLGQKKYIKAKAKYEDGLATYLAYRQHKPHQDIAMAYAKLVEYYISLGNYDEGIQNLLKAFNTSGVNIKISSLRDNPKPQDVFSKRQLLQLLDLKLQLLQIAYFKTKNKKYLDASVLTNNDILSNFDLLKMEFESKLDKQFLAETAYPIFHRMLEATYLIFQNNPSSELLELALNISEKNKDFLLLEALRNTQANKYNKIPKDILERESQLRAEITYLEKEIFNSDGINENFSKNLLKVKQQYFGFLDSVKLAYPKYYGLKYQTTDIELKSIRQKVLDNNGILASFTLTDKHLYTIVVDEETEKFLKVPFSDSDRQMIRNFYKLLSKPSIGDSEDSLKKLGRSLYKKLLKIPLRGLDIENISIVPDAELHYLPFDMLIKDDAYLLETANIGYGNSVASLLELKQNRPKGKGNVLAFAPGFKGLEQKTTERDFGKLLYNDDEVQQIQSYFETDIYSDSTATLENFMSFAPNQSMIHLATHASANDQFPDYSYLAFSENTNEDNILYIKDLYNMSLSADMVTLSACQTGIGKLQKGQGMLSLSKGFYYAGAKSLVNTLWKINDKSTVKLMQFFYEGLSKGKSKTEALREAKLRYLENTDDNLLKHPYYWAAFVVSGDTTPISNPLSNKWWALLLIPIFASFWYLKKKKSV